MNHQPDESSRSRRKFLTSSMAGISGMGLINLEASAHHMEWSVPNSPDDNDWDGIRKYFITKSGIIFMNNASLGMPPQQVVHAVGHGYSLISKSPVQEKLTLQKSIQQDVLSKLAKLLNVNVEELVLTRNASEALHLATVGLKLSPGDEVIITSQEHPSGKRPWKYREARKELVLNEVLIPSPLPDPKEVISRLESVLSPRTRAIAFCHITRGGHLYPVREIIEWSRNRKLVTVVDGAQALGMIPVDVGALGCDAYCASLHKWMLAPLGTGFLYVREAARGSFNSLYDADSTLEKPNYDPTGTMDLPIKAAIGAALDFHNKIGSDAIAERLRLLSDYLKEKLIKLPACRMLSGSVERSGPGSTIFELEGIDPVAALAVLEVKGIFIDEHVRDGHKAFRISTHYYNTTEEIDLVIHALKEIRK